MRKAQVVSDELHIADKILKLRGKSLLCRVGKCAVTAGRAIEKFGDTLTAE